MGECYKCPNPQLKLTCYQALGHTACPRPRRQSAKELGRMHDRSVRVPAISIICGVMFFFKELEFSGFQQACTQASSTNSLYGVGIFILILKTQSLNQQVTGSLYSECTWNCCYWAGAAPATVPSFKSLIYFLCRNIFVELFRHM